MLKVNGYIWSFTDDVLKYVCLLSHDVTITLSQPRVDRYVMHICALFFNQCYVLFTHQGTMSMIKEGIKEISQFVDSNKDIYGGCASIKTDMTLLDHHHALFIDCDDKNIIIQYCDNHTILPIVFLPKLIDCLIQYRTVLQSKLI